MIPKIINYIWLGKGNKSELCKKCIDSWKKKLPDYKIIEWNEDNFDINSCLFVKEAYEAKQFAFASDYIRLYVLYKYGGIYMDTDVEVIKDISQFLELKAFTGFESETAVPTGIMAAEKGLKIFEELISYYDNRHFVYKNGKRDTVTNVEIMSNIFKKHGLIANNTKQTVCNITFFPKEYFCPKDVKTLKLSITENSFTLHHFDGSWQTSTKKTRRYIMAYIRRVLGPKLTNILESIQEKIRKI